MVSSSYWMCSVLVFTGIACVASSRLRDVPLGLCGICEVNCFEDCALKYDREIIQADLSLIETGKVKSHQNKPDGKKDAAKKAVQSEIARMKAKSGKKCSKADECGMAKTCAANIHAELKSLAEIKEENAAEYERFEEKELQDAHDFSKTGKTWADTSGMKVTISDMPEWHAPSPSALTHHLNLASQNATKGSLRGNLAPAPGVGNDPNDPRTYFPLHPVKIGAFSKGLINMDQCLKYCLATTCGCEGVPGMEDGKKMDSVEEEGKKAGTHFNTPPVWKYRKAKKENCGHGLGDNKVIKDLYVDFNWGVDGWLEVCTKEFFDKSYGAAAALGLTDPKEDLEKCDCGVNRLDCHEPKFGCSWNHVKSRCEYKAMHNTVCYERYTFDKR